MIEEAGMSFYSISGDVVDMMGRLLQPDAVGVRYLKEFEKGIRDIAPMLLDDLLHCAEGAEAIVCTFFGSMFYSIAESTIFRASRRSISRWIRARICQFHPRRSASSASGGMC